MRIWPFFAENSQKFSCPPHPNILERKNKNLGLFELEISLQNFTWLHELFMKYGFFYTHVTENTYSVKKRGFFAHNYIRPFNVRPY